MYDELKEFGLSENEIVVYVALLKTGNVTANRIARKTGMKRSTTYDNLNILTNKGLVSRITKDKVNFYEAADPGKIVRLLEERKEKVRKIVPKLQSIKESAKEKIGATFFEGKKGIVTVLNDVLDEGEDFLFYGSRRMALIALQYYPDNFIEKRANRKIMVKAVLSEEDRNDPAYKDKRIFDVSKLRFSKELNQIETNVFIYSDRVAFITSGENLAGIIVKNKELVLQQRRIFDMLWKLAKK